ncbi:MAG: hypothetical protein A4E53_00155 [Pelotomaculum sp. PtaB.Bin104]|nr:MAG: hypothetical protein A4E53_00155 [Pelotomaculum sp. PtaB.Bin104]
MAKGKKFAEVSRTITKNGKKFGCSCGKDDNGYFVYTHRARSKSYESLQKIPIKVLKFIDSTG